MFQILVKTSLHFACVLHAPHAKNMQRLRTSLLSQLFKMIQDTIKKFSLATFFTHRLITNMVFFFQIPQVGPRTRIPNILIIIEWWVS
jgi:hypothetical protein